jgi:AraC-like DNA-binding protein
MEALWPIGVLPRIRMAGRYRLADHDFPIGYLHDTIAIHLHEYRARWRIGARELRVLPGDVTVSPPRTETRYDIETPGECWCVHFDDAPASSPVLRLPVLRRPSPSERSAFSSRFARLVGWSAGAGIAAAEGARAALYEIIAALAARDGSTSGDDDAPRSVERATAWLDRHYRRDIGIAALCDELGIGQDRLASAFRRHHGCTMLAYLARRRVEHAHLLLSTTAMPIATVAALVGIPDRRYFTRVFRRITGRGPAAVRRRRA